MKVYVERRYGFFYHRDKKCPLILHQPKGYQYDEVELTEEVTLRYRPCSLCTKKGALHHG